jgi:Ca2+-binding EF-hand superfamily protein
VVLNAFSRIAKPDENNIDSLDIVTFFRDNSLVVSEADCYMLVQQFDSNGDGLLSLADLMKVLAPKEYTFERNMKLTKKFFMYGEGPRIPHDVEFAIMQVL